MAVYSIRDLEKLSGIKAHTIRIWEKRYKLIEPQRTSTNIRTYCDTELKKILNISILNRHGIKISKIAQLTFKEINDKINQITERVTDSQSQIESLTIAMIEFDEIRFEHVLARSIIQFGFEDTIIKIMYPFLIKIGLMWQTGSVNPAQEHFISNLARQKIFVAIDGQINAENPASIHFLFFLPEGELHELGLLFYAYLAKKRGHHVVYLGQSVPLPDLAETLRNKSFDVLVTAFVSSISQNDLLAYVQQISEKSGRKPLFLSGSQTRNLGDNLPENVKIIASPQQFIEVLEEEVTSDK
jgi:MerR family transcriptional regulator, light-induced transcriptional regulator